MANCARGVGKNLCSRCRGTGSWFHWRFKLMLDPLLEISGRLYVHTKPHVGMRIATEFRALPIVFPRNIGDQSNLIHLPGDDIAFTANLRHEKTVNHILGNHLKMNRLTRRNMNLIGGYHPQRWIVELPPPLMSNYFDRQRVFGPCVWLR